MIPFLNRAHFVLSYASALLGTRLGRPRNYSEGIQTHLRAPNADGFFTVLKNIFLQ